MQQITDAADVARGTFYQHFRDKASLIAGVIEDEFRESLKDTIFTPHERDYQVLIRFFRLLERYLPLLQTIPEGDRSRIVSEALAGLVLRPLTYADTPIALIKALMAAGLTRSIAWWVEQAKIDPPETIAAYVYQWWYRDTPPSV